MFFDLQTICFYLTKDHISWQYQMKINPLQCTSSKAVLFRKVWDIESIAKCEKAISDVCNWFKSGRVIVITIKQTYGGLC